MASWGCFGCFKPGNPGEDELPHEASTNGSSPSTPVSPATHATQPTAASGPRSFSTPCRASPQPSPWLAASSSSAETRQSSVSDEDAATGTGAVSGELESPVSNNALLLKRFTTYLQDGNHRLKAYAAESLVRATSAKPSPIPEAFYLLRSPDVLASVVELLRCGTDQGRIHAAGVLQVLADAGSCPGSCAASSSAAPGSLGSAMARAGAPEALLVVGATSELPAARRAALYALARIVRQDECALRLVVEGGVAQLVTLISSKQQTACSVHGALLTLYYLGADRPSLQQRIAEAGAIPPLLEIAAQGHECKHAQPALQVIKMLSKSYRCALLLRAGGALDLLRAAITDSGDALTSREAAMVAMERLSLVLASCEDLPSCRSVKEADIESTGQKSRVAMRLAEASTPRSPPCASLLSGNSLMMVAATSRLCDEGVAQERGTPRGERPVSLPPWLNTAAWSIVHSGNTPTRLSYQRSPSRQHFHVTSHVEHSSMSCSSVENATRASDAASEPCSSCEGSDPGMLSACSSPTSSAATSPQQHRWQPSPEEAEDLASVCFVAATRALPPSCGKWRVDDAAGDGLLARVPAAGTAVSPHAFEETVAAQPTLPFTAGVPGPRHAAAVVRGALPRQVHSWGGAPTSDLASPASVPLPSASVPQRRHSAAPAMVAGSELPPPHSGRMSGQGHRAQHCDRVVNAASCVGRPSSMEAAEAAAACTARATQDGTTLAAAVPLPPLLLPPRVFRASMSGGPPRRSNSSDGSDSSSLMDFVTLPAAECMALNASLTTASRNFSWVSIELSAAGHASSLRTSLATAASAPLPPAHRLPAQSQTNAAPAPPAAIAQAQAAVIASSAPATSSHIASLPGRYSSAPNLAAALQLPLLHLVPEFIDLDADSSSDDLASGGSFPLGTASDTSPHHESRQHSKQLSEVCSPEDLVVAIIGSRQGMEREEEAGDMSPPAECGTSPRANHPSNDLPTDIAQEQPDSAAQGDAPRALVPSCSRGPPHAAPSRQCAAAAVVGTPRAHSPVGTAAEARRSALPRGGGSKARPDMPPSGPGSRPRWCGAAAPMASVRAPPGGRWQHLARHRGVQYAPSPPASMAGLRPPGAGRIPTSVSPRPRAGLVAGAGGRAGRQLSPNLRADAEAGDWAAQGRRAAGGELLQRTVAAIDTVTTIDTSEILQNASDGLDGFLIESQDVSFFRAPDGRRVRLGEGGFAAVYKGIMNGVDEVAVKVVKKTSPDKRDLKAFLAEASTLGRLHHRNVVQLYGACLKPGCLFLVMELMRGGDLYHALRLNPDTMRWDSMGRKVALDIALGLHHLHSQKPHGIMHRDLKSPNVLLSEEGVAKVADVGMSRTQVSDVVTAQQLMTPLWAAPEVVSRDKASCKADIWSLGIMVWEIATGRDITEFQPLAISRQMSITGPRTLTMPADAPPAAVRVFDACTHMDPLARPNTAQIVEWLRDA